MAERFSEGMEEETWFFKNKTYVDDATGGAQRQRGGNENL
jgi:hypothetical protein